METVLQILVGLISLMMLGLGGKSLLAPKTMVANFAVAPVGVAGLNTIRGVIGGFFVGSLALLVTGLVTGQTLWFVAVAVLLGAIVVARVIGLALDGFDKAVAPPLVVETVMVAVLLAAHVLPGG